MCLVFRCNSPFLQHQLSEDTQGSDFLSVRTPEVRVRKTVSATLQACRQITQRWNIAVHGMRTMRTCVRIATELVLMILRSDSEGRRTAKCMHTTESLPVSLLPAAQAQVAK